jgi:hypothetical protein
VWTGELVHACAISQRGGHATVRVGAGAECMGPDVGMGQAGRSMVAAMGSTFESSHHGRVRLVMKSVWIGRENTLTPFVFVF